MADIINHMTPEGMIQIIDRQIEKLDTVGSDDMIRLRKHLEHDDSDPTLWFDLGIALNQAAMQRDYLVVDREQLLHPGSVEIEVDGSGSTHLLEEALTVFHKVLEMEPDYYGVYTQMGIVYSNLHRYDDAEQCYLHALKDDDEDFSAAYYLGLTYRDKGDEALAEKYLALARELNPDDDTLTNAAGLTVER